MQGFVHKKKDCKKHQVKLITVQKKQKCFLPTFIPFRPSAPPNPRIPWFPCFYGQKMTSIINRNVPKTFIISIYYLPGKAKFKFAIPRNELQKISVLKVQIDREVLGHAPQKTLKCWTSEIIHVSHSYSQKFVQKLNLVIQCKLYHTIYLFLSCII